MADEWDEPGDLPTDNGDDTGEGRPAWLDKGSPAGAAAAGAAARDEWDVDDAAPDANPRTFRTLSGKVIDKGPTVSDITAEADAARAENERHSLLSRAKATAAGMRDTFVGGAKAVGGALPESLGGRGFLNTIADPHHRREFERGLSDMITLGYAEKLGNMAGGGAEKLGMDFGPRLETTGAEDAAAAPNDRALGRVVGMAAPGVGSVIAKNAGKVIAPVFEGAEATTRAGAAALGAAKGVAGHVATAPLTAGLSANAAGDRLGAAADALTDPVSLALAAGTGAIAEPVARNLTEKAKERATKDIGHDIVEAEGPKARVTDQKRIAEVNDRIFEMTKEHPELRQVWREPAEKALPKVAEVKRRIAEPLDAFYDTVDAKTGGGIRLGDIIDGYRNRAKELRKTRPGVEDANRLDALADQELVAARARQGAQFDPKTPINAEGTTAGDQLAMLERSATRALAKGDQNTVATLQGEADRIRELASKEGSVNLDERIPTKDFRANVTALHKSAESVMGGLEGTPRHEALAKLYDEGKAIIDKHLDSSGVDQKALTEVRKINNEYFLLSRAEAAIESRGWKEANQHSGFHLPHSAKAAIAAGGATPLVTYGLLHPSHIPALAAGAAATAVASKAIPAITSRINWRLANLDPAAAARTVERIAPRAGAEIGGRAGAAVASQQRDRAIAQIIQGAQAGGDPGQIRARATAEGVDPAMIDSILQRFAQQPAVAP